MGKAKKYPALIVAYFLIYVVWGSTYYFIGTALKELPPFLLGSLRFTSAGLLLLAICRFRKEPVFNAALIRRSALSGIILLFVDMAVIMLAQRYISSSLAAIIASSTAIWIMLFDVSAWKQSFRSIKRVTGIMSGFAGIGMLYYEQLDMETRSAHSGYGILLLIGGCVSWALGTLHAKYRSCSTENTNGFAGSAWQMLSASFMFTLCAVVTGEVLETDYAKASLNTWLSLAYLVYFGSILAYSAYIWLLKVRPATEVATHAYVNPVVAVLIGAGFGGEQVTAVQLAGLVIILSGVMLVSLDTSHRSKGKGKIKELP